MRWHQINTVAVLSYFKQKANSETCLQDLNFKWALFEDGKEKSSYIRKKWMRPQQRVQSRLEYSEFLWLYGTAGSNRYSTHTHTHTLTHAQRPLKMDMYYSAEGELDMMQAYRTGVLERSRGLSSVSTWWGRWRLCDRIAPLFNWATSTLYGPQTKTRLKPL